MIDFLISVLVAMGLTTSGAGQAIVIAYGIVLGVIFTAILLVILSFLILMVMASRS